MFEIDCKVYVACKMTGRSKVEQVVRAKYMCAILHAYGLEAISPVIEENVEPEDKPLSQMSEQELYKNWSRDKEIMVNESHVVLLDGNDEGSIGMSREYGFNRYCLWKPTVTLWNHDRGITVADFEDDSIFMSAHEAAAYIAFRYGSRWNRWKWRAKMLYRTLPKFIERQIRAWR